jgi:hypothetical protein
VSEALYVGQQQQSGVYHKTYSIAVAGAANSGTGPIRITTAANKLKTGDRVTISGILGTVEANGAWTITVVTATTFDLQGSTFTNAYTSGGTVKRGG